MSISSVFISTWDKSVSNSMLLVCACMGLGLAWGRCCDDSKRDVNATIYPKGSLVILLHKAG